MAAPYTLLYVSEASATFEPEVGIEKIVVPSIEWNRSVGITGLLLYSGGFFSQYLEGDQGAVEDLIAKIKRDPRHHSLVIVQTMSRPKRIFPRWSLAYAGDAAFVTNEITRLYTIAQKGTVPESAPMRLIKLMQDFLAVRAGLSETIH